MAYNPINFQNTEAGGTPLSASNLNHLEQGIIVANELVPESAGNAGQVLTKTENGTAWQNTQESLPSGGTVGQVLTKTETGSAWQDTDAFPEEGTVGQVLTKSANGVQWTNAGNPTDTQVSTAVTAWLDENVTEIPQTAPIVDTSLTIQGAAADAKKTGEEISDLKSEISDIEEQIDGGVGGLDLSDLIMTATQSQTSGFSTLMLSDGETSKSVDIPVASLDPTDTATLTNIANTFLNNLVNGDEGSY